MCGCVPKCECAGACMCGCEGVCIERRPTQTIHTTAPTTTSEVGANLLTSARRLSVSSPPAEEQQTVSSLRGS